jgi:hypothetical protein
MRKIHKVSPLVIPVLSPIDVTSIIRSSLPNQPFEFSAVTLKSQGIKAVYAFILLLFIVKYFCEVGGGIRVIERFQALWRPTNGPAGKTS